jgi:hypothetical protein
MGWRSSIRNVRLGTTRADKFLSRHPGPVCLGMAALLLAVTGVIVELSSHSTGGFAGRWTTPITLSILLPLIIYIRERRRGSARW